MTLNDAPLGMRVRIHALTSRPEISTRLRELGFCENAIVRCLTRGYGNIICEVYNTRVGLNSGLAGGIHVSQCE
ncbi:MAG: FeoA family protein [Bacteroidota bacterium]